MVRNNKKVSFDDLVRENKEELLNDEVAMEAIEERLDNKHSQRLNETL